MCVEWTLSFFLEFAFVLVLARVRRKFGKTKKVVPSLYTSSSAVPLRCDVLALDSIKL